MVEIRHVGKKPIADKDNTWVCFAWGVRPDDPAIKVMNTKTDKVWSSRKCSQGRTLSNDDYIVDSWFQVAPLSYIEGICDGRQDDHLLLDQLSPDDVQVYLCSDVFWDGENARFMVMSSDVICCVITNTTQRGNVLLHLPDDDPDISIENNDNSVAGALASQDEDSQHSHAEPARRTDSEVHTQVGQDSFDHPDRH